MAQARNPLLSGDARGTFNKTLTFTHQSGHNVVQGYKKPRQKRESGNNPMSEKMRVASKMVSKGWKSYNDLMYSTNPDTIPDYITALETYIEDNAPQRKQRGGSFRSGTPSETNNLISLLIKSRFLIERINSSTIANRSDTALYINELYEDGFQYQPSQRIGIGESYEYQDSGFAFVVSREPIDFEGQGAINWLTKPIDFTRYSHIIFSFGYTPYETSKEEIFIIAPDTIDINQNATASFPIKLDSRAFNGTDIVKVFITNVNALGQQGIAVSPTDNYHVGAQLHDSHRQVQVGRKLGSYRIDVAAQGGKSFKFKQCFINVRNKSDAIAAQSLLTFDFAQGVSTQSGSIVTGIMTRGTLGLFMNAQQVLARPSLINIDGDFGGATTATNSSSGGEAILVGSTGESITGHFTIAFAINCRLQQQAETGLCSLGISRIVISQNGEIIGFSGLTPHTTSVRINRTSRTVIESNKTEIVSASIYVNAMGTITLMNTTTIIKPTFNPTRFGAGFLFSGDLISTGSELLSAAEDYLNETYRLNIL